MKIPKNAILIDRRPIFNSEFFSVIICRLDRTETLGREFVTWIYNHEIGGCVSGHYFDKLIDAAKDFEIRN